jgi:DUF4097 and DUF4098 domain-containing protein YvlB
MSRLRIPPLFCGLLILGAAAHGVTLKERFDKTVPLRPGAQVRLTNVNGGVSIEAWDRNEVRVEAEKQVKARDSDVAHKVMAQIHIDVTPDSAGLRVDTRVPKRGESGGGVWDALFGNDVNYGVTYTVHVPRQTAVDVVSTNGGIELTGTRGGAHLKTSNGGLTARNVEGNMELKSTNGAITVAHSSGALKAVTTNGGIQAELSGVPANADLSLESTNGGVSVRLPRDARFSLDAATSNGGVESEFPIPGTKAGQHRLEGEVNGGGPKLLIRTSNGGIHIRSL